MALSEKRKAKLRDAYWDKNRPVLLAASRARQLAKKAHVRTVSDLDCAYAAGIIDGEGCIRLNIRKAPKRAGVGQITLLVHVTNTALVMLEWLNARWPAPIHYIKAKEERNCKAQGQWTLTANNALHFLDDIAPYMVVKREQLKVGRRFQRYLQRGGRHRSEKLLAIQMKFALRLKELNHRGLRPFIKPKKRM